MEKLFNEFLPASFDDWKKNAEKSLKGKPFDDLIKQIEGVEIQPYYDNTNNAASILDKTQNSWSVFQQVKGENPEELNRNILLVLNSGVNAIEIEAQKDYSVAFNEVLPEHIATYIFTPNGVADIVAFAEYVKQKGYDKSKIEGGLVQLNDFRADWEKQTEELFNYGQEHFPSMKTVFVFNQEETIIDNIATNLAKANEYFHLLTVKSQSPKAIIDAMQIHFEVGSNYFFEIAKFRAFKRLFALIAEQYGVKNAVPFISASTKLDTSSAEKDYKNMLRATTQAMSAVIGGCDSLSVTTFDGSDSEFALRIARNVQLIVQQESYLDRVVDPSFGSYYIEELTNELATKAWNKFKAIEAKGGYVTSTKKGAVNA